MPGRLEGKKCLISAAGQGIGRAAALAMHEEGAEVFATDINEEALKSLKRENLHAFMLDVRSPASIEAARADLPPLDVLFNCAGFVADGTLLDCSPDEWAFSFDLNVTAMYQMIRAFLPAMLEKGGGSIINMSSAASSIIAAPRRCAYGATKAAIIGLTKSVAVDFVKEGIRCNAICPGTVDTPSLEGRMRASGDYETARERFIARQPMGRVGRAEEIASLAVYLASDESAFVTGACHVIDGGWANA